VSGSEPQIIRYNMPFGRVGAHEFGTYFIGHARDPDDPPSPAGDQESTAQPASPPPSDAG
jgi:hypothetical protein